MRRFDPFFALSTGARRAQLDAHRAMMSERDGALDLTVRTLERRESFFASLDANPVHAARPLDRAAFEAQWNDASARSGDLRIDWITAAMRANEGETYGVELELARFARQGAENVDPHLLAVALEEHYHPQILGYLCRIVGVDAELQRPKAVTRLVTRCMNHLPTPLRMVFILAGEVVGTVFFRILLERCDLFDDDPPAQARLRALVEEIVIDETGHVAFCRARVSDRLLPLARALAPWFARGLLRDIPEFGRLVGGNDEVVARVRAALPVPEAVHWLGEEVPA